MKGILMCIARASDMTLSVSPGGTSTQTWDASSRLSEPFTLVDIADDIALWSQTAWGGATPITASIVFVGDGLGLSLSNSTASTLWFANSTFTNATKISSPATSDTVISGTAVPSGVAVDIALRGWVPLPEPRGARSISGGWAMQPSCYAKAVPSATTVVGEKEHLDLAFAMANSTSPRTCHIYQDYTERWRALSLGKVEFSRLDSLYRVNFSVQGATP